MDRERAKELLRAIHSCQESGCQEDCDAACALLESDPELQAWFEEEMGSWSAFDQAIAESSATLMLWEGPPLASTRSALDTRRVMVVVFDPAANVPAEGDFLEVMRANVNRFSCASGATECK